MDTVCICLLTGTPSLPWNPGTPIGPCKDNKYFKYTITLNGDTLWEKHATACLV